MAYDMKEELKPCPFCGGEAYVDEFAESMVFITCSKCHATIKCRDTETESIEAWNTRTERTCMPKARELDEYYGEFCVCPECEDFVPMMNYCPECGAKFERK